MSEAEVEQGGTALVALRAGDLFLAVKAVQRRALAALRPVAFNVGWNHGRPAGQHVFHLHVHVIPRYGEGGRGIQLLGGGGDPGELAEVGAALRAAKV